MFKKAMLFYVALQLLGLGAAASAQQPRILPEELQVLAIELGIDEKLGIKWEDLSDSDVARYINTLSAIDVAAERRAIARGEEKPSIDDYRIAASILCFWDYPFKPPAIPEYRDKAVAAAYGWEAKQQAIADALGETFLYTASSEFEDLEALSMTDYMKNVIDFDSLY